MTLDTTFLPRYDEAWSLASWITFYLFVALLGQRAPDDKLYERSAEGAWLRKPRGVPRAVRPGLFAAVAVLQGAASFVVHRDGGWEARTSALALGVTVAAVDAVAVWVYQHWLWLRFAAALRFALVALAGAVVGTYGEAVGLAAGLAVPQLLWLLYLLGDCALVLMMNRAVVASEVDAVISEVRATPLDPLPPPPVHRAAD